MNNWQALLTYPQHVRASTRSILDTLEALYPPPAAPDDRGLRISKWLDGAVNLGLLTRIDRDMIRFDIAPNL
jgi:hypothetical protein